MFGCQESHLVCQESRLVCQEPHLVCQEPHQVYQEPHQVCQEPHLVCLEPQEPHCDKKPHLVCQEPHSVVIRYKEPHCVVIRYKEPHFVGQQPHWLLSSSLPVLKQEFLQLSDSRLPSISPRDAPHCRCANTGKLSSLGTTLLAVAILNVAVLALQQHQLLASSLL